RTASLGAISSAVTSSGQGKMLDVFVPVNIAGTPGAGSAELRFPYAPIAASISSQNGKIEIMLIAGLLLLWGTLLTVVGLASRLDSVLRNTATVARLGGDEFAILLTDVHDRQQVVPVVRRILKVLEEPVVVGGLALQVEASIGIAMFPEHGRTVDAVMRAADVAMYVTKEQRSGYEFYDEERPAHRHH